VKYVFASRKISIAESLIVESAYRWLAASENGQELVSSKRGLSSFVNSSNDSINSQFPLFDKIIVNEYFKIDPFLLKPAQMFMYIDRGILSLEYCSEALKSLTNCLDTDADEGTFSIFVPVDNLPVKPNMKPWNSRHIQAKGVVWEVNFKPSKKENHTDISLVSRRNAQARVLKAQFIWKVMIVGYKDESTVNLFKQKFTYDSNESTTCQASSTIIIPKEVLKDGRYFHPTTRRFHFVITIKGLKAACLKEKEMMPSKGHE